jgi:Domain of unknown function (DUF3479)
MLSLLCHCRCSVSLAAGGKRTRWAQLTQVLCSLGLLMHLTKSEVAGTQCCNVLQMVGYLSFLKIGPKLLKFLPGNKARDLRNWLQIYGMHPCAALWWPCLLMPQPC